MSNMKRTFEVLPVKIELGMIESEDLIVALEEYIGEDREGAFPFPRNIVLGIIDKIEKAQQRAIDLADFELRNGL